MTMRPATGDTELISIRKIAVCEVGPRDGLQSEKASLTVDQKVELIERSAEAGAKFIEVGSMVHPKAVPQMADTDEVARRIPKADGVEYRVLVMNVKGIDLDQVITLGKHIQRLVGHDTASFVLKAGKCSDIVRGQAQV